MTGGEVALAYVAGLVVGSLLILWRGGEGRL